MRRGIAALLLATVLAACATSGVKFDPSTIDELIVGQSTLQDAIALLGPQMTTAEDANGTKAYGWSYGRASGLSGRVESRAVMLIFGPDGKLQKKSFSASTPASAR